MNCSVQKDLESTNLETSTKRNICRPFRALHVWQATKRWDLFSSPHRSLWRLWLCAMAAAELCEAFPVRICLEAQQRGLQRAFFGKPTLRFPVSMKRWNAYDHFVETSLAWGDPTCLHCKSKPRSKKPHTAVKCLQRFIWVLHLSKLYYLSVNTTHFNQ